MIALDQLSEQALEKEKQDIATRIEIENINEALFFPKFFQIETTRICNAKCNFCPVNEWDKSVTMMSDKLFDKITEELGNYSDWIKFVCLQRAGEPLLDKKIANRVYKMKKVGIKQVTFSTNASRLFKEKSRELLESGLDEIMFSVDSVDKAIYEKTRVGLKYERVMHNIMEFFKAREEINPEVIVRVRGVSFHNMQNENEKDDLKKWEEFWEKYRKPQDRIYMKRVHNWGNQKEWEDKMPQYDWVYHPCILPWSTMHITAMGIVPLCAMDYDGKMNMGDINRNSIAEVWKNTEWNKVRSLHSTGKRNEISFCQGCRLFDLDFSIEDWQQKQLYS